MRYMATPTRDSRSIDDLKSYTNGMDVDHSNGVFNKTVYNLVTTPNWDPKKAFGVFLQANQYY